MTYRRIRLVRVNAQNAARKETIGFAAKELNKYLTMADPDLTVDEMVVTAEKAAANAGAMQKNLVLRVSEALAEELKVEDPALDDGYRIDVTNDHGVIEGTNERSVLLGAYRFLKELGFGFVRPGKGGERIPENLKAEYSVKVCEKAAYRHRGWTIEGSDTYQNILDTIDFLPKCGMNEYFIQFWVPGTFFDRWYHHASNPYLEDEGLTREDVEGFTCSLEEEIARRGIVYHKTGHGWTCEPFGIDGTTWDQNHVYHLTDETKMFLAEVNGKRELWGNVPLNTNLCYSNSEVRDRITSAIRDYCLVNRHVDVIHFWLADGSNNHCECAECRKKRPSDWYVTMLNELDEKLTAAHIDTRIVFLIYVDLLWEPVSERIRNSRRFILMFAPITRYYGDNYSDSEPYSGQLPDYQRNHLIMPQDLSENLARLQRWQDQFDGDSFIFDYHLQWAHASDPGYEQCAENMYNDMVYLKKMGLNGNVSCQVQRCFFPSGIVTRALAAALWNPERSFAEVEEEYYREAYGEKGPQVQAYLSSLSSEFTLYRWYRRKKPASKADEGPNTRPYGLNYVESTEKVNATLDAFLPVIEEGIAAGGCAEADYRQLKIHSGYVRLMAELMAAVDRQDEEAVKAKTEETIDYLNRHELEVQPVMDGDNYRRMLLGKFQGTF